MGDTSNCVELESRIRLLEKEAVEYVRKEEEFCNTLKWIEYSHMKRSINLMRINEELLKEIKELRSANQNMLSSISEKHKGKIDALNCLYSISRLRSAPNFSMDTVLQDIVDAIPGAAQDPERVCARILFNTFYEIKTRNYRNSELMISKDIMVFNDNIGTLEVCLLDPGRKEEIFRFLNEADHLIAAIAESVAQIVEREWAEEEIRKSRRKIMDLVKMNE
jgi:hypothetical protein